MIAPINFDDSLKSIRWKLQLILTCKILGYFTLSENIIITQGLKIFLRVGMTILVFQLYKKLKKIHLVPSFSYNNIAAYGFYLIYLLLSFLSFSWSTKPGFSMLQWVMATESLFFVAYFIKIVEVVKMYFPTFKLELFTLFGVATTIILSGFLIGAIVAPDQFFRACRGGEENRFGGYLMNPNELGMLASMGASMGIIEFTSRKNKILPIFILAICITSLVLTSSRSSTIGFLLIAVVLLQKFATVKMKLLALIAGASTMPFISEKVIFKSGDVEEVMSMTGRLPFWKALLNEGIVQEPFFGYGFMRIYYKDKFQGANTYAGEMTHNTFMQVLMNLGFVGIFLVLLQVGFTIYAAIKVKDIKQKNFFLAMFIPIIINSFSEFGIFGEANYGILFYQFLITILAIEAKPYYTAIEKMKLKKVGLLFKNPTSCNKKNTSFLYTS